MKSKLCVAKICPGHMQRQDTSCTHGELGRREPGRTWRTRGRGMWNQQNHAEWQKAGVEGPTALGVHSVGSDYEPEAGGLWKGPQGL